MEIFLFWLVLSILVVVYARSKGKSGILYFFLSLILSPFLAFLIALVTGDNNKVKCNNCGQKIDINAKICPFCMDRKNASEVVVDELENTIYKNVDSYKLLLSKDSSKYSFEEIKKILLSVYDKKVSPYVKINNEQQFHVTAIIGDRLTNIGVKNEKNSYLIESYKIPIPKSLIGKRENNTNNVDKLIELGKMYEKGLITKEEFDNQKSFLN